jgi:hypothetical protein
MDVNEILKRLRIDRRVTAVVWSLRLLGGGSDCRDVSSSTCIFISEFTQRISCSTGLFCVMLSAAAQRYEVKVGCEVLFL